MTLLAQLQNQRVHWAMPQYCWADFRDMVPMALIGNFPLNVHMEDLGKYDKDGLLQSVYKSGVGDWMKGRSVEECLKSPQLWEEWKTEYYRALTTPSDYLQGPTSAQITCSVMREYYLWDSTFLLHPVERLQLALLHIQHLPVGDNFAKDELSLWSRAKPDTRLAANADVGAWYNLVQDETLLHWYITNKHSLNPTTYTLPENTSQWVGDPHE